MSMIFQSYAVWPHMTVAQNVASTATIRVAEDGSSLTTGGVTVGGQGTGSLTLENGADGALKGIAESRRVGIRRPVEMGQRQWLWVRVVDHGSPCPHADMG